MTYRSCLIVVLLFVGIFLLGTSYEPAISKVEASTAPSTNIKVASYWQLPLAFEPNQGQSRSTVKFLARGSGYSIYLEPTQATLVLRSGKLTLSSRRKKLRAKPALLRVAIVGGNADARITGSSQLPGKVNYLLGNDPSRWLTDIPTFARVEYQSVYSDIDLVYYGNRGNLEYDFVVRPGASPETIRLKYTGISGLRLASNGDLLLNLAGREIRQQLPSIYQQDAITGRTSVSGHYHVYPDNEIGFSVAKYDRKRALIIDPALVYSGILGGSNQDAINAMAIDSDGNAYLAGSTSSADFPTTAGAYQTTGPASNTSISFISKLNPTGTALIYSTFLGGTSYDFHLFPPAEFVTSIFVDAARNVIVGGQTSATNFPTTASSVQPGSSGCANVYFSAGFCDGFVAKLNASGSALLYSSYLGGTGQDQVNSVAVDASGMIYAAGTTISSDYPTTPGALKTTFNAGGPKFFNANGFITKIDPSKTGKAGLVYSTYLGGTNGSLSGMAVDSAGSAYVTGITTMDFPVTPGAIQATGSVLRVVYAAKLTPSGSALTYGATFGGPSPQFGDFGTSSNAIAIDTDGNAYITGTTDSSSFPVTPGAFQTTFTGSSIFVSKLNPTASAFMYSTFLDGTNIGQLDSAKAILVDGTGNAYATGGTFDNDFPTSTVTLNPMCGHNNTCLAAGLPGHPSVSNAFVSELNPTGSGLVFSTFLGGNANDEGRALALDGTGNIYVAGAATSCDFPTTAGAITDTSNSCRHGFVSKISVSAPGAAVALLPGNLNFRPEAVGTPAPQLTATLTNRGNATLNINNIVFNGAAFTESNNCPGTLAPAANCTFTFGFSPPSTTNFNGQLNVTDNGFGSPHIITVTGVGGTPAATLSGTSLTFANQIVNTTSGQQSVTLKDLGSADLHISSIAATGDFAQTNNCGTSLALGATCTINVTFTPTTTGPRNGSVTITDNASTSPQTILLGGTGSDFVLTPMSSTATVSAGQTASYTVNVAPNGSLSQTTSISCTGAPAGATCSANPNSIPPGSATTAVGVTVSTTAQSGSAPVAMRFTAPLLPGVCTLLVAIVVGLLTATRPRKRLLATGAGLAMFFLLLVVAGCGGGGSGGVHGGGTPPGTYSLTVTATSGNASRSTTLSLIVH